ncbi:MAG: sulfatase [Acidobacteria bacterium]|nr:sulfatase [Acidobacteriota bacterium]MCL5289272.1 sulfatase [Acidobacteriota bacterium]
MDATSYTNTPPPSWRRSLAASLQELGYGAPAEDAAKHALVAGAWLGLVFGFLEAAQHWIFRPYPNLLTIHKVSAQIFWVAPALNMLICLVLACSCILVGKVLRRWPASFLAVMLCAAFGVFGLLTLVKKIHNAGAALAALGVAVALARTLNARPAGWRFFARTLPALLLLMALIGFGVPLFDRYRERAEVAALPPPPSGAPNVLVIVMDTARADHLSLHGYARPTTPKLDRWAQRGTVFDNAWSTSSWTHPAHASLLTGRPAYEHGADRGTRLDARYPVLGEFFVSHGYRTAAFSANDIWISPEYGFGRGFQRFRVYNIWSLAARTVYGRKIYSFLTERLHKYDLPVRRNAAVVNKDVLQWLDENSGRPFFALINYFDAHDPYWPTPEYAAKFAGQDPPGFVPGAERYKRAINNYDGLLAYLDDQIDALFSELARRGLAENTIVVLTSDHGESLGNHGEPQHGKNLYQEVMRVHLVVVGRGRVAAARRVDAPVSLSNIPATLAELLGWEKDSPFPGPSFASFLQPQAPAEMPPDETVLGELKAIGGAVTMKSLVNREWQYIWNAKGGREELYRLQEDPKELTDLAQTPEGRAAVLEFREKLRAIFPALPIQSAQALH